MNVTEQFLEDGRTYNKVNFSRDPLKKGEYENCHFINCDFPEGDLSEIRFVECQFVGCNLSLANIKQTTFFDVLFKDCKMLGLRFDLCRELGLSFRFENCRLDHSVFFKRKLKKTVFNDSVLTDVDFTDGDLTASVFDKCNLSGAVFENTVLEKVDFRTSFNYTIDPDLNRVKRAKFALNGIGGLLTKHNIIIDYDL